MHALEFPRSMHSLSLSRRVSLCACASPLICKLNADLSIKTDRACVLATDLPVITTQSHRFPQGHEQSMGQVNRTHTNFRGDL